MARWHDPVRKQTPAKNRTLSGAGIKKLQTLLDRLDLEPGPQDGLLGDRTIEAIKLYQRFAGLPVDGKPTLDLLLDLRQGAGAMSAENPPLPCPPTSDKPVMPTWGGMTLSVVSWQCPPDSMCASHGDAPIGKDAQRRHGVKKTRPSVGVSAPRLRCGACPMRQHRA